MKKKIIIISLLLLLILIVVAVWPKYKVNEQEKKRLEKETKEVLSEITKDDITYKEMQKIIGKDITNVHLVLGPNSYLRNRPSKKVIKEYELEEYIALQEKLVKKVEDRYKNNLEYKVVNSEVKGNQVCEKIEIKGYYYALYLTDLINLTNELADNKVENVSKDVETEILYFKSQLKALEVLDKHLDEYENTKKEKTSAEVCYKNGKVKDEDTMLSLVVALQGETYENCDFSKQSNITKAEERLKKYLQEI